MEGIDILGIIADICTSSSILPQIMKTIKEKKTQDVSIFMFIVLLTGQCIMGILWY